MNILLGSDHYGHPLKTKLIPWLQSLGHTVTDVGGTPEKDDKICDYADAVAGPVSEAKGRGEVRGILLCMSGGFMVIRANKFKHVRATLALTPESVAHDREASDINILALAASFIDEQTAQACVQAFLNTPFEALERRVKRLERLEEHAV